MKIDLLQQQLAQMKKTLVINQNTDEANAMQM
jgi:hypothetical protein